MKSPLTQLEQLTVTSKSKSFLKEISSWCFFFSILGFISILLFVVVAVLMGTVYAPMLDLLTQQQGVSNMGTYLMVVYLIVAILYFFPVLYLFKFSRKMKAALATKNDDTLADAFENLKSHFKFIGVMTIIFISLYALLFVFSIFAGSLI
ncbi:DUF5362 family protein [Polaribacter sp.]|uniref:DUF5362 family protein n=1 Tax=Polaribacter sp. TaxID=1920175 RepID=UPI003F6A54A2